jgi:coatomer protein complex subunit gamma
MSHKKKMSHKKMDGGAGVEGRLDHHEESSTAAHALSNNKNAMIQIQTMIYNPYSSKSEAAANVHEINTEDMSLADLLAKDLQMLADKAMKDMLMGDDVDDHDHDHYADNKNNNHSNTGQRRLGSSQSQSQFDARTLDKAKILQEANRLFNDSHLVRDHPLHCGTLLVQLLQLEESSSSSSSSTNNKLTQVEAIDVFFGVSKLFLSPHPSLRRLVYLFLKSLLARQIIPQSDVIIIQSCLTKDMVSAVSVVCPCPSLAALYKANSLRVLVQMMNAPMLSSVERYIKSMLVDFSSKCDGHGHSSKGGKGLLGQRQQQAHASSSNITSLTESARVSSAALVSALHLSLNDVASASASSSHSHGHGTNSNHTNTSSSSSECAHMVQKWVAQVHDAMVQPASLSNVNENENVNNVGGMVQFHAIMLMYVIKRHDRRAIQKLISQFSLSSTSAKQIAIPSSKTHQSSSSSQGFFGRMRAGAAAGANGNMSRSSDGDHGVRLISPLAAVLTIRITTKYIRDEYRDGRTRKDSSSSIQSSYRKISSSLTHGSAMVAYEASNSIVTLLPEASPQEIATAIDVLHALLKKSSSCSSNHNSNKNNNNNNNNKPCITLAALKTLSHVAQTYPSLVARTNDDLQTLIADPNRLIGTLAMTTLLQTAAASSSSVSSSSTGSQRQHTPPAALDRYLAKIALFVHKIEEDEYKVHIIASLRRLCLAHPSKHKEIVDLMGTFLRDEGGYAFKKYVVQAIVSMMQQLTASSTSSDTSSDCDIHNDFVDRSNNSMSMTMDVSPFAIRVKDLSLSWLCECMEDCAFTNLTTYILHLIGIYGTTKTALALGPHNKNGKNTTTNTNNSNSDDTEELQHYEEEQRRNAAKYSRFIFNRYMLDQAPAVRAAVITTLTKFAISIPPLRPSILTFLLKRAMLDDNDEVRDRTVVAVHIVQSLLLLEDNSINNNNNSGESESGITSSSTADSIVPSSSHKKENDKLSSSQQIYGASCAIMEPLPMSFDKLAAALRVYADTPEYAMLSNDGTTEQQQQEKAITFGSLSSLLMDNANNKDDYSLSSNPPSSVMLGENHNYNHNTRAPLPLGHDHASAVYAIPEFASLGKVLKSCLPAVELTERETEYVVSCVKHILPNQRVVLQFLVENTCEDQRLVNVTVAVDVIDIDMIDEGENHISSSSQIYSIVGEVPAVSIAYGTCQSCFTLLERGERGDDAGVTTADGYSPHTPSVTTLACELHFSIVTVDPDTGEDLTTEEEAEQEQEEYHLDGMTISTPCDFMMKQAATPSNFKRQWESLGREHEVVETYALAQYSSIKDALEAVVQHLGMQPCDGTGRIQIHNVNDDAAGKGKAKAKPHMLHLSGMLIGGTSQHAVLAIVQLALRHSGPAGSGASASQGGGGGGGVILKIGVRSDSQSVSRAIADSVV